MPLKRNKLGEQMNLKDLADTCRVCMKRNESMKNLFQSDCNTVQEIHFCTGILLIANENLPSSICTDCLAQLAIAHSFKTSCANSEETFQELLSHQDVKEEIKSENLSNSLDVKEEIDYTYSDNYISDDLNDVAEVVIKKSSRPKTNVKINRHLKVPKYRQLYCSKCDLKFKNRREYTQHHQRDHANEKWVCEICGKQYVYQSSHYAHVLAHGPSKHACALCDYSTSHKSDLKKHMHIHTGVREFQCHICANWYRTTSNLYGHIQRVHGAAGGLKSHKCDKCDKKFYSSNLLKRHLDSHNNVKRYECEVCHSRFSRRCHWKKHLQKQHAISTPPLRPGRCRSTPAIEQQPSIFNKTV